MDDRTKWTLLKVALEVITEHKQAFPADQGPEELRNAVTAMEKILDKAFKGDA